MGKRKANVPKRTDESQRQILSWNMGEQSSEKYVEHESPPKKQPCPSDSVQSNGGLPLQSSGDGIVLNKLIEESDFYLTITKPSATKVLKGNQQRYHIGNIELKLMDRDGHQPLSDPPLCDEFYLYINMETQNHMLYYEFIENDENQSTTSQDQVQIISSSVVYYLAYSDVPVECFASLQVKPFQITIEKYDSTTSLMTLKVHILDSGFTKLKFAAEAGKMKKTDNALQTLFCYFYGIEKKDNSHCPFVKKHDFDEILQTVKELHAKEVPSFLVNVQHQNLKPSLREYQKSGVLWMLEKEGYCKEEPLVGHRNTGSIHPLYQEIITLDGKTLYFNKHSGFVTQEKPLFIESPPGGILGDEMGLGKTVEVLACILCHPRKNLPILKPLPVVDTIETKVNSKRARSSQKSSKSLVSPYKTDFVTSAISHTENSTGNEGPGDSISNNKPEYSRITSERSPQVESESPDMQNTNYYDNKASDTAMKSQEKRTDNSYDSGNDKIIGEVGGNNTSMEYVETNADKIVQESSFWNVQGKRQFFECICGAKRQVMGEKERQENADIVQCEKCNLFQHAKCVGYDLGDPFRGWFLCPHCHASSTPIPSGATLIITPNSISHQWVDEILKHIRKETLNVFVYDGVHKQGYVQPQKLANQDIVITTYETLRKEIDYVDLPHSNSEDGRKLRRPKRYMATPSPITAVEWWRICLDEAQMVECTATKTAEMALRLSAVNRWCVTGTPIQKGLEDVYGLFLFLGVDPYWVRHWWKTLLYQPFCYGDKEPLIKVLASVLWRTAKKDVVDEICLPIQSEKVHTLTFSPVEEHFYKRQYHACAGEAMHKLRKYTDNLIKLNDLDKHSLHHLLLPLTKLRQACCHPQAVKGEFLPIHKSMMTMEELLNQLTKKAKQESEEAHRQYVAAKNGLAALHLINGNHTDAVEKYREVLQSVEEHKKELRTDELQQLHAMHNLNEILKTKPQGIHPTLRDSQLEDCCKEIRVKYMQKAENFVTASHQAWIPIEKTLRELQVEFKNGKTWWADLIEHFVSIDRGDRLVAKIKEELSDNAIAGVDSILRKFRDVRGLLFILSHHLDELQTAHDKLVSVLRGLANAPTDKEIISKTVECCLRPSGRKLVDCVFCKSDVLFTDYEGKLFCFTEKGVEAHFEEDFQGHSVHTKRQGTWADSEVERCLKALISLSKSWGGDRKLIEYGNIHVKMFEALKKEFKAIRTVWIETKANVASVDELDMATTRIRLRLPCEPMSDPPQPNIIPSCELDQQKLKFTSDQIVGKNDLRKKLGQLLYLKNLASTQGAIESGKNPEPCPICQRELGCRWSVLHCGHCFCMECMRLMIARYSFGGNNGSMKCPVCRQKTRHADIAYVSTKKKKEMENDENKVKGDHSTKVEAVIKCLLNIQKKDPDAKSLVFSTWHDVLGIIAKALDENNITYKSLQSYKFQANLASFKHDADITVLLLPIHSGANGLNLIEATNILLVEPVLNPAQELQAIGRIHRIGQTRPTFVHRFLVKGTIEEKIHSLLQTTQAPAIINSHNTEQTLFSIGDFKALFEETDFMEIDENDDDDQNDDNQNEVVNIDDETVGNLINSAGIEVSDTSESQVRCTPEPHVSNLNLDIQARDDPQLNSVPHPQMSSDHDTKMSSVHDTQLNSVPDLDIQLNNVSDTQVSDFPDTKKSNSSDSQVYNIRNIQNSIEISPHTLSSYPPVVTAQSPPDMPLVGVSHSDVCCTELYNVQEDNSNDVESMDIVGAHEENISIEHYQTLQNTSDVNLDQSGDGNRGIHPSNCDRNPESQVHSGDVNPEIAVHSSDINPELHDINPELQ